MNFSKGDIVIIPVPFTDNNGFKLRPAVVISNDTVETARIMAQKNEGIEISNENSVLVAKMKRNHKNQLLSESEKNDFLKELQESKISEAN